MAPVTTVIFTLVSLATLPSIMVAAQEAQCFYPNGNTTNPIDLDIPCSGSKMCCPLNWACLSNGLCQDITNINNTLERRTCQDKDWGDGCLQKCNYTAAGNEAVQHCNDGKSYCCNGNGQADCCAKGAPLGFDGYFDLPVGTFIGGSFAEPVKSTASNLAAAPMTAIHGVSTTATGQATSAPAVAASSPGVGTPATVATAQAVTAAPTAATGQSSTVASTCACT